MIRNSNYQMFQFEGDSKVIIIEKEANISVIIANINWGSCFKTKNLG